MKKTLTSRIQRQQPYVLFATWLVGLILLTSCSDSHSDGASTSLVLEKVYLISMETDEVKPDQSVVIVDNQITYAGPADKADYPDGATVINAQGKYVMPGLCDMHMHIDHPDVLKVNLA